jgi:hypothetical protein
MDDVDSLGPTTKKTKKQQGTNTPVGMLRTSGNFMPNFPMYDGYEPGIILPPGTQDGFDTNIVYNPSTGDVVFKTPSQREATKLHATGPKPGAPIRIYTDGSSLRNGQKGGYAGVGVYFGPNDSRYDFLLH